jgi:hypothetical protein
MATAVTRASDYMVVIIGAHYSRRQKKSQNHYAGAAFTEFAVRHMLISSKLM